jgi:hypothetical protein
VEFTPSGHSIEYATLIIQKSIEMGMAQALSNTGMKTLECPAFPRLREIMSSMVDKMHLRDAIDEDPVRPCSVRELSHVLQRATSSR